MTINRNNVLISIIIPCHNVLDYIDRALNSCFAQTHKNIEIILVENGSTDNSWIYCQELAKKHKGVIFAYQSNPALFAGGARNLGIEKARGDYLAFLDDDDTFYPEALLTLLNYCLEYDLEVAIGSMDTGLSHHYTEQQSGIFLNDSRFNLSIISAIVKLYNRSFIRKFNIKFDTIRLSEDIMFFMLCKLLARKIGVLSFLLDPIYTYTVYDDSSILTVDKNYKSIVCSCINIMDEFDRRVNILEQKRRIVGDFYGTDLEKIVLAKACQSIIRLKSDLEFYNRHNKMSQECRYNVDKYLLENNVFARITAFEQKYEAKESSKLYYHQMVPRPKVIDPPRKHGIARKIILRTIRLSVKILNKTTNIIKKLDNKISKL